ncbi:hypothetical protein Tco_1423473, partial [Tanacetum coccineum]
VVVVESSFRSLSFFLKKMIVEMDLLCGDNAGTLMFNTVTANKNFLEVTRRRFQKTEWLESVLGSLRMSKQGGRVMLLLKLLSNLAVMDVTIVVSDGKIAIKSIEWEEGVSVSPELQPVAFVERVPEKKIRKRKRRSEASHLDVGSKREDRKRRCGRAVAGLPIDL